MSVDEIGKEAIEIEKMGFKKRRKIEKKSVIKVLAAVAFYFAAMMLFAVFL